MATKKAAPATKATAKTDKAEREVANGVTRPAAGGLTGKLWALADKMSKNGLVPRAKFLLAAAEAEFRPATAASQYARYRKFMGVVGRTPKEAKPAAPAKAVAAPKAPKPPAVPKAPKPPKAPPIPPASN